MVVVLVEDVLLEFNLAPCLGFIVLQGTKDGVVDIWYNMVKIMI